MVIAILFYWRQVLADMLALYYSKMPEYFSWLNLIALIVCLELQSLAVQFLFSGAFGPVKYFLGETRVPQT
jgi:hypothetical protein